MWRWHRCLDPKKPGCARRIGKPAATGAGYKDIKRLLEPFSSLWKLAFKGLPWLVLLWCLVQQAFKGPSWLGSLSIAQCVRHSKGHHLWGLSPSAASISMWGERGYSDGPTPCTWLSSITLPPELPSFPPRTFFYLLPHIPSGCLPQSIAILVLGLLSSPYPATVHSGRPVSLSGVHRAAVQIVCVVLTPFRPSQISCFILQQPQMPSLCLKLFLRCGGFTPASVPPPHGFRSSPTHSLSVFSLPSFILPSFASIYVFPSGGQGLQPALSWCSVRSFASEDVFLMQAQREIYSASTYCAAISSSPPK